MRHVGGVARDQRGNALRLIVAEDRKAFLLRLPPDLWKDLEKWAADELRSVNSQIEYVLRQAVRQRKKARDGQDAPG